MEVSEYLLVTSVSQAIADLASQSANNNNKKSHNKM